MDEKPDDKNNQSHQENYQQIAVMREEMLRFSTLQLRDPVLAEDVVHEAINAALASDKFAGRGALKSWVFAILRNKIVDVIRGRISHPTESCIEDGDDLDSQFDEKGRWKKAQRPANWGTPEEAFANDQFWVIFNACLHKLPKNTAQVFMMREHLGLEIIEICNELGLSNSNAWVIMHRARMQLRKCLEINFIQGERF